MGGRQRCLDELLAAWQAGLHRPLFIIQHALCFGLGARLITAYSVHKEEPDITSPCHRQWGAIWTSRASREGILSLPGGLDISVCPDQGCSSGSISIGKWNPLSILAQCTKVGHRTHLPLPQQRAEQRSKRKKLHETKPLWASVSQTNLPACPLGSDVRGL